MEKYIKTARKFNSAVAVKATLAIGTMWCVYAFALLVLIPVIVPSTQMVIMYISSSFLQLVFLPLIMVGQAVLSEKSEKRAQEDHETLLKEFRELKQIHSDLHAILGQEEIIVEPAPVKKRGRKPKV